MDQLIKKCISSLKKKLGINPNPKIRVHSIALYQECTDLITQQQVSQHNISFACKKGCAHCCNLRVEVLPPEAFYIASHIKSLPDIQQSILIKNLEAQADYAKDRLFSDYNKTCAFLTEKATCSIYPVRPHKCRSYLSKSIESCVQTQNAEEDPRLKMAQSQLSWETIHLYKNKNGVMHPAELGQSVLAVLKDAELEARWANGEQVFEILPERIMF